jgi:hypothetical protein
MIIIPDKYPLTIKNFLLEFILVLFVFNFSSYISNYIFYKIYGKKHDATYIDIMNYKIPIYKYTGGNFTTEENIYYFILYIILILFFGLIILKPIFIIFPFFLDKK